MSCKDCFNNCGGQIASDQCVQYTGEDIPLLGICAGDSISLVEQAIIEKLLTALDGTGITLSQVSLSNAAWVKTKLGVKDQTLINLIQMLVDSSQSLKDLIDGLTKTPTSFNTSCLTGLPASPTSDQVLQAALNTLCSLKTTVDSVSTTYVKNTDLTSKVTAIITTVNTTAPDSSVTKWSSRMVPFVAYEYYGSLSNFDSTGKGITAAGFEKVYLCNGNNGTPDKRGRTTVGAVKNVPGPALDAAVDPNSAENSTSTVNYGIKDKFGENFHKQTIAELPPHPHQIIDPGHTHAIETSLDDAGGGGKASVGANAPEGTLYTKKQFTGITVTQSAGSGNRFNVRQPSIAAYFIMYIP